MQESAFKVKKYVEISYRKKNLCASKHKSFLPTVLSRSSFQIPRESASSGLIRSYMIKATNIRQKKDALDIYRSHVGADDATNCLVLHYWPAGILISYQCPGLQELRITKERKYSNKVWTNDEYESVKHRVVVNSEKERSPLHFSYTHHPTPW
nr:hypothetical protein CFP56_55180 [Quercus suber]